jgi:hypothetical protein
VATRLRPRSSPQLGPSTPGSPDSFAEERGEIDLQRLPRAGGVPHEAGGEDFRLLGARAPPLDQSVVEVDHPSSRARPRVGSASACVAGVRLECSVTGPRPPAAFHRDQASAEPQAPSRAARRRDPARAAHPRRRTAPSAGRRCTRRRRPGGKGTERHSGPTPPAGVALTGRVSRSGRRPPARSGCRRREARGPCRQSSGGFPACP